MNEADPRSILMEVFTRLRLRGVGLGVGELLDGLRALDGGWGAGDVDELKRVARLLWCHSPAEVSELEDTWASATGDISLSELGDEPDEPPLTLRDESRTTRDEAGSLSIPTAADGGPAIEPRWMPLPVPVPTRPEPSEAAADLLADRPISRRSMAYVWRYLRRPVPDGPENVLDVGATVERAARQGFFLAPVYRRRLHNHYHLVLLFDQNGSMAPFHRFSRDLAETARHESMIRQVDALYFHNVPPASVYLDPHLTSPVPWDQVETQCSSETGVLIVSDAGAARGFRRLDRIRTTTRFLARLRRVTNLVAWLNPMPEARWPGTTAQAIAHLVPMFPMDPEGLSNAVDVLRGQVILRDRRSS